MLIEMENFCTRYVGTTLAAAQLDSVVSDQVRIVKRRLALPGMYDRRMNIIVTYNAARIAQDQLRSVTLCL